MNIYIAHNLTMNEVVCPCCKTGHMHIDALVAWEVLRGEIGVPIIVNSAFRCAAHNKRVGGQASSRHLIGQAFDLKCPTRDLSEVRYLAVLLNAGFRGIGRGNGWVHVDTRDEVTFWKYTSEGIQRDLEAENVFARLKAEGWIDECGR